MSLIKYAALTCSHALTLEAGHQYHPRRQWIITKARLSDQVKETCDIASATNIIIAPRLALMCNIVKYEMITRLLPIIRAITSNFMPFAS